MNTGDEMIMEGGAGVSPGRLDEALDRDRFVLEVVNGDRVLVRDAERGDAVVVTFAGCGGDALMRGVALAGELNARHAAGGDVRPMLVRAVETERRDAMQELRRAKARVREVNARLEAVTGPLSAPLSGETPSVRGADTPQSFLERLSGFAQAQRATIEVSGAWDSREEAPVISGVAYDRTKPYLCSCGVADTLPGRHDCETVSRIS